MYIFQQKKEDKVEPLVVYYYLQRERQFVSPKRWTSSIWW